MNVSDGITRAADHQRPNHQPPPFFPAMSIGRTQTPAPRFPGAYLRLLCVSLAIAMLFGSGVAFAEPTANQVSRTAAGQTPFAALIDEASQRFGIPAAWIRAVMLAESLDDPRAVSPMGAIGLMQIMPKTWAELRLHYGLGADPYDPHDNIIAGTAYLHELSDRYGSPGFLAAYNAGPALWEDYLATGRPLPDETRAYLARLAPIVDASRADNAAALASVIRSSTEAPLFPARSAHPPIDPQIGSGVISERLSTGRATTDLTGLAPQSVGLFVVRSKPASRP
jgi:soluble lytic murein transglycosylase-like protein